ncbi:MAG TPA: DUF72 domain-containing protein [Brevundimonas sp.]|jgi:uncharacterized protein YecE (DUF72 family)|uniref:DUF72 domain-containing protein n=1 Tax=Brevundimonas sp. TaxID=1871086 RepID=UPI002DE571D2|nr:DUF72 domain-containing protein [Brevundimonas sp.]
MGDVRIGTSGWAYKDWNGPFYPDDVKAAGRLAYISRRFRTLEINASFYRMPTEAAVAAWRGQTPDAFLFAWKASRFITHNKKLRDPADPLAYLFARAEGLGAKLGPVLFQLPPNLHRDDARLQDFLDALPAGRRYSVEFRHPGWYADAVLAMLTARNVALCISDHHHAPAPWQATADFIYLRGHGPGGRYHGRYGEVALRDWAGAIRDWQNSRDVFVYFDNDIKSAAPADADQLIGLLDQA